MNSSETSHARISQSVHETQTFARNMPLGIETVSYKGSYGLLPSNNAIDTDEFINSNISPMAHNLLTPVSSVLSDGGEVNSVILNSFNYISIFNATPIINDILTPIVSSPLIGNKYSCVSNDSLSNNNISTPYVSKTVDSEESLCLNSESHIEASGNDDIDDLKKLKNIRLSNVNRLVIGQLNINSLRYKFDALSNIVKGMLDILVLTETKIDLTFPTSQFLIEGFCPPFRHDRTDHGGGILIYVREDIPCKILKKQNTPEIFEGIFLEVNLRKRKWLLFGGYNPSRDNISNFVNTLGPILDEYMPSYDNFLILGDFNAEVSESIMEEFCAIYNLKNLINVPTCFKKTLNPSSIDVILTNRFRSFQNSVVIETGLSDYHKMTITVLKTFFQKQVPTTIRYRDYKKFDLEIFRKELVDSLNNFNGRVMSYDIFEELLVQLLNRHAPLKEKCVRANNASFMNKTLSKAFMTRSCLRNKFLCNPNSANESNFKKFRNYCTSLVRKEKRKFFNNLNVDLVTDNKKIWKTVRPLFSEKHFTSKQITLLVDDKIISSDKEVAETFNLFFSKAVENLHIKGFDTEDFVYNLEISPISNIIYKFRNHPSIIKIK